MQFVDDRIEKEAQVSHRYVVLGRDRFMSGWGLARGGYSWCGWACRPEDNQQVQEWVRKRGDIQYVRVVVHSGGRFPVPRSAAHFHIYHVHDGHNALRALNPG